MGTYRRIAGLVGAGCCVVAVTACGELLNARTNTADGSPSVDANATGNNGNTSNSNKPVTDTNTPVSNGNTPATDSNTPATNGNMPATDPNASTGTSKGFAATNGCTPAKVTYATGASSIINSKCTSCHSGSQAPNLSGYANAKTGFSDDGGGGTNSVQGTGPRKPMPFGSALPATQKCVLFNWADNNYAE